MPLMRSENMPLVECDLYMQGTIDGLWIYLQGIDPCFGLYFFTAAIACRPSGSGIKCVAAGVQDIERAARGACDLPGGDAAATFAGGVEPYVYIIVLRLLFVIKSQIADSAILNVALFYMPGMEIFISVDKSDVLQQLIEDLKLFGIFILAFGIFYEMYDEIGRSDAFFMLKKRKLRMIAQLVGEQAGMVAQVEAE